MALQFLSIYEHDGSPMTLGGADDTVVMKSSTSPQRVVLRHRSRVPILSVYLENVYLQHYKIMIKNRVRYNSFLFLLSFTGAQKSSSNDSGTRKILSTYRVW